MTHEDPTSRLVCRLVSNTKKKEGKAKGQSGVFWGMRSFGVGGPIDTKFGSVVGLMDLAKCAKGHDDNFIRFYFIEV